MSREHLEKSRHDTKCLKNMRGKEHSIFWLEILLWVPQISHLSVALQILDFSCQFHILVTFPWVKKRTGYQILLVSYYQIRPVIRNYEEIVPPKYRLYKLGLSIFFSTVIGKRRANITPTIPRTSVRASSWSLGSVPICEAVIQRYIYFSRR